jgi:hypothetical protein
MNERIQHLSDIAYKNHLKNNPHSSFGRRDDYDREFAELIVRECAKVVFEKTGPKSALNVLEHFGVEE